MRIIVTSDTHRSVGNLFEIVEKHMGSTDLFISLGDEESDWETVLMLYPDLKLKQVAGNNDWYSKNPTSDTLTADGKKIFFTHGHPFYVKRGYEQLIQKAKDENAAICLFGHTHIPYENYIDNIHFLNPGSVRESRYGIIDISGDNIMAYSTKI